MKVRRQTIPQRQRIFVGCEGESEQSYVAVLNRYLGTRAGFHLVSHVLNGGDPLALVESANKALRTEALKARDAFARRFVLLDADLRGRSPDRDEACVRLAKQGLITLIWQEPCHEAMLLRHLEGCANRRPANSELSFQALVREWPQYRKNMPAVDLSGQITRAALRNAVANHVESEPLVRAVELHIE
jgi:hypothetical protein